MAKKEDKDISFENSISHFTLNFKDPDYERGYHKKMDSSRHLNSVYKALAYTATAGGVLYRIMALINISTDGFFKMHSKGLEIAISLIQFIGLFIDILLKAFGKWRNLQGFFFFSAVRVTNFALCFYTQSKPAFSLGIGFLLMVHFPTALIFMNNWLVTAASGIVVTTYFIIDYTRLYARDQLPFNNAAIMITGIACINYTAVFYYGLEKGYRNLFFLEKERKREKKKWKDTMDCLPVGIMLTTKEDRTSFVNSEANAYLLNVDPCIDAPAMFLNRDANTENTMSTIRIPPDLEKQNAMLVAALGQISDSSGVTLKTAIEYDTGGKTAEKTYNMVHSKTHKYYEVKTKLSTDYKITVIKDQTLYQNFVKEKMLKKYLKMLLASISHEVRNPLNAIEGYSSIILDSESKLLSSTMKENLTGIQHSARHIEYIVNGACFLVLVDNGAVDVQEEEFDIVKAVENMVQTISCNIVKERVKIEVCVNGTVPNLILSDQSKYNLILFNLLVNAVKYTQSGKIVVTLALDPASSRIKTTVTDTGCGISEEKVATLFELYSNIESVNLHNPQGMGLGLALCKKLSALLGGDIVVSSKLNEGTTVSFTIKDAQERVPSKEFDAIIESPNDVKQMELDEDNKHENDSKDNITIKDNNEIKKFKPIKHMGSLRWGIRKKGTLVISKCSKCPKALIVDDELTNRMVLKAFLGSIGIKADEAENGLVALEKVLARARSTCCKRYSIICMDINMPVMDGTTATRKLIDIFKEDHNAQAPIIAVTAANLHSKEDMQELLSVGFTYILQKPVTKLEFIHKIKPFL